MILGTTILTGPDQLSLLRVSNDWRERQRYREDVGLSSATAP